MAAAAVLALMLGAVQSVRDYLLSGWLQFPLSVVAFDVPWRAPDPVWNRTPTLGAARDPSDLWAAAEGYEWIPAWLGRLPSQWETYYLLVLLFAAAISWLLVRKSMPRARVLLLVMVPCAATVLVWFVATPPSFRFAWGVVFAIPVVIMAWSLQAAEASNHGSPAERVLMPVIALGSVAAVMLVIGYSAVVRLDVASMTQKIEWSAGPLSIPLEVTPITPSPVSEQVLESGLIVRIPTQSDQCWAEYPLCTAQLDGTVSLRGATLQDGFRP
jgi:hypothetical protein